MPSGARALVDLDEERALDAALVGAKAAALAAARRRGLRVLAGFVVPAGLFAEQLAAAEARVEGEGVHGARLACSLEPLAVVLLEEARRRAALLGERYVCRSSSPAEGDASYAGAFSSFIDVSEEELGVAISGCVASVFRPEVAAHLEGGAGFAPLAPSVLVQRLLEPGVSGTALKEGEGRLSIAVVTGPPGPLLAGWVGGRQVDVEGAGVSGPGLLIASRPVVEGVVDLFRALDAPVGTRLEWAEEEGEVYLLQVGRGAAPRPTPSRRRAERAPLAPDVAAAALRAAHVIARAAGGVGELLLLPWQLAPGAPRRAAVALAPGPGALARAGALAAQLNAAALAGGDGAALLDALASPAADADLRRAAALRPVEEDAALELLAVLAGVEESLRAVGALPRGTPLAACDPAALEAVLGGGRVGDLGAGAAVLRRWQRLLQLAARSAAGGVEVVGAAPGAVAGLGHRVRGVEEAIAPGEIVVLERPLPRFAPLLWRAGGLVCLSGHESAHLLEVARSRRVPAVLASMLGAELLASLDGSLLALDGDAGELFIAPEGALPPT